MLQCDEILKPMRASSLIKKSLNIALVPANMARLSFGPCKKKNLFLVPAKFFVF